MVCFGASEGAASTAETGADRNVRFSASIQCPEVAHLRPNLARNYLVESLEHESTAQATCSRIFPRACIERVSR